MKGVSLRKRYLFVSQLRCKLSQQIYKNYSLKKAFFSDPSTYPLMLVLGSAATFVLGMSINGIRNKNVHINPKYKHNIMNQETKDHRTTVTEIVGRSPIGFHRQSFKDIRQEGLGVNHEGWVKAKKRAEK